MSEEVVEVYVAKDKIEVQFIRSLIENAGIKVEILSENLHSLAGEVPLGHATAPRILVRHDDVKKARKIVEEYEASNKGA